MNKKGLLLFFLTTSLFAQYQVTIEAIVLDKESKQPIAFANIGFIEKSIGTVSDENGQFILIYDEAVIHGNEVFQISSLGYHAEGFVIDDDAAGESIINVESINKEPKLNPTYLKYNVYRNYGLANETKEIMVINLNNCKPKITFDKRVKL